MTEATEQNHSDQNYSDVNWTRVEGGIPVGMTDGETYTCAGWRFRDTPFMLIPNRVVPSSKHTKGGYGIVDERIAAMYLTVANHAQAAFVLENLIPEFNKIFDFRMENPNRRITLADIPLTLEMYQTGEAFESWVDCTYSYPDEYEEPNDWDFINQIRNVEL